MVRLPIRKFFHIAKVTVVILTVICVLAAVEKWRGGRRTVRAAMNPQESVWEQQILEDERRIVPGLGEGGVAAQLTGEDEKLGQESVKKLAMNVYLSDRIAYNRSLQDHRNPACERVVYDAELPSASVIIIFHNEPYSVVLRTVWSVINSARRDLPWFQRANFRRQDSGKTMNLGYPGQDPSSPFVYLKEIILVDDNSTLPELKGKLSHYIRTRLPADLIRVLRLPDRVGLTRARLAGARYATGDVMVFLDSHCEVQIDWLRPLLQRINDAPHAVLVPIIDVVDSANFYYSVSDPTFLQVGGFTFMGHFTWIDVPEREKKRRGSDIAPTWSPTMAGGLFAINREYYWELGAYDEQMAGWGGENLEMSFRIWQCGGTLETIPCSRVGHVFRSFHPYSMPASSDTHGINTARMAEVWMDDYKELFYLHRPDLRKNPMIGDVTHRKVLREKLQCKNFEWYLQHIYKEKFVPVRDAFAYGRFKNGASGLCLDTLQREAEGAPLGVYPCHETLQGTQYLSLSLDGQLRDEEKCVELQHTRDEDSSDSGRKLLMFSCSKNKVGQKFRYSASKQLIHVATGLCVDAGFEGSADVLAKRCDPGRPAQRWDVDYSEHAPPRPDAEMNSVELTLQRLRGQRRISRSLLAYDDNATASATALRRHAHKKRRHSKNRKHKKVKRSRSKTKNKFILKLVRTLMNNSEEHLEMDIHCQHRQLFPNNSFVRDLVTIFNEKNIKVINNGRVFERNRVSELAHGKHSKVLEKMEVGPPTATPASAAPPAPPPPEPQPPPPVAILREAALRGQNKVPLRWPPPSRQRKSRPSANASPVVDLSPPPGFALNSLLGGNVEAPEREPPAQPDSKKIIIEDFVAVTSPSGPQHHKKHKSYAEETDSRKRTRDRALGRDDDAPAATSLEEAQMPVSSERELTVEPRAVSDEHDRDTTSEHETGAAAARDLYNGDSESRYTADSALQQMRRQQFPPRLNNDFNQTPGPGAASDREKPALRARDRPERRNSAAPLKVVMKSNLTFNLGDEFFNWRAKDDVADILGELTIPANGSRAPPPMHAWVRPTPPPPATASPPAPPEPRDTVLTAYGAHSPPADYDDSSSSSESSESDR